MYVLGFPYVRRASKAEIKANPALRHADRDSARAACAGFRNHPTSVLIFLEGTRFTAAKRDVGNSRFKHLLNPRTAGLGYALGGLADELAQLIDVTIFYPQGPPTFWGFLQGKCPQARMTIRAVELSAPLLDDETQSQALPPFIEALWQAKDKRLGQALKVQTSEQG